MPPKAAPMTMPRRRNCLNSVDQVRARMQQPPRRGSFVPLSGDRCYRSVQAAWSARLWPSTRHLAGRREGPRQWATGPASPAPAPFRAPPNQQEGKLMANGPVLLSGGEEVLDKARMAMEAGALGLIFGRNVWQREHDESLRFVARLRELLEKYPA